MCDCSSQTTHHSCRPAAFRIGVRALSCLSMSIGSAPRLIARALHLFEVVPEIRTGG